MSRAKTTTLRDVATEAGVSISTASRALANNPAISINTRQRIKETAKRLNYRPNAQARALRSAKTNTIGVAVPSLINHYYAEMATIIQQEAATHGYATIIANTNENPDELRRSIRAMSDQRVDGLIIVPNEGAEDVIRDLLGARIPTVLLDRKINVEGATSVTSDPFRSMTDAVKHLVDHGHTPIGYLSGPMSTSTGRKRLTAFEQACEEVGIAPEDQLIFQGGYMQSEGRIGAAQLIGEGAKALIAGDSMMTLGVIETAHSLGLDIGTDLAVIGFDDYPLFALQPKPITIIDQDVASMSIRAFNIVKDQIDALNSRDDNSAFSGNILTPTSLIIRESSDFDASTGTDS